MKKLGILVLLTILSLPLAADDIVVREVGGLPVIHSKIHYGGKHIEAHILFDIGFGAPMVIHEKSIGGLGLNPKGCGLLLM